MQEMGDLPQGTVLAWDVTSKLLGIFAWEEGGDETTRCPDFSTMNAWGLDQIQASELEIQPSILGSVLQYGLD